MDLRNHSLGGQPLQGGRRGEAEQPGYRHAPVGDDDLTAGARPVQPLAERIIVPTGKLGILVKPVHVIVPAFG
jgi:hypothetical protein